jgi:hypothetical protein
MLRPAKAPAAGTGRPGSRRCLRRYARDPYDALVRHGLGIGPRRDEQPNLGKRCDDIFGNLGKQTLDDHPVEGPIPGKIAKPSPKTTPALAMASRASRASASIARLLNRSMESTSRASRASNAVA